MILTMREWLADCEWPDMDEEAIGELEDHEIISAVSRHYDGGLTEFVRDTMRTRGLSRVPFGWDHV